MNVICACGFSVPKGTKCDCRIKQAKARQAANDKARGSASDRGYDARWAKESKAWLAALGEPLCACGCGRPANMVDHIRAPKGDMVLFWDRTNWQPFARGCNSRKNIKSEGGFGR
ncbi:HNH endonuclease [Mesorhizobium sp. B2-6-6]|nr:HNH endonuclease [Mesorhizobium sp. B2-6-6]